MTIMSCSLPLGTLLEISSLSDFISQYLDSQNMFGKQRERENEPQDPVPEAQGCGLRAPSLPIFPACLSLNLRELSVRDLPRSHPHVWCP